MATKGEAINQIEISVENREAVIKEYICKARSNHTTNPIVR